MKLFTDLPAFQGVAEGQEATLNLPLGETYHGILLKRGGGTFNHDHMVSIVLKINGKPIQDLTGVHLDDMNAFDGAAVGNNTTGLSYISFERLGLDTQAMREATAIGTRDLLQPDPAQPNYNPVRIKTMTLHIKITGATSPTLSAKARLSGGRVLGAIKKIRKFSLSFTGAGKKEVSDIPLGDQINRIWLFAEGGHLTDVTLTRDRFEVFNRTELENDFIQADGVKAPVGNLFVLDPTELGAGMEAIVTRGVEDFRLGLTNSQSENITMYVEYLGGLEGN